MKKIIITPAFYKQFLIENIYKNENCLYLIKDNFLDEFLPEISNAKMFNYYSEFRKIYPEFSYDLFSRIVYKLRYFTKFDNLNDENLIKVKDFLVSKEFWNIHSDLMDFIENFEVVIYGYDEKFDTDLFFILKDKNIHYSIKKLNDLNTLTLTKFSLARDEISYVLNKIDGLLLDGANYKDIVIITSNSYLNLVSIINDFYKLPLLLFKSDFSNLNLYRELFDNFSKEKIDEITKKEDLSDLESKFVDKLLTVYSEIEEFDLEDDLIKEYLIKSLNSSFSVDKGIKVFSSINDIKKTYKHVFVLGLNTNMDSQKRDNYALSAESLKNSFEISPTEYIQSFSNLFINYLCFASQNNDMLITFSSNSQLETLNESSIINKYSEFFKIEFLDENDDTHYSEEFLDFYLADKLYSHKIYNTTSRLGQKYLNLKKKVPFEKFDNSYKRHSEYLTFTEHPQYSPTSLDKYFDCGFKYYLSKFVFNDSFEQTLDTQRGNFLHKYIENFFEGKEYEIDITKYYEGLDEIDKFYLDLSKYMIPSLKRNVESLKNYLGENAKFFIEQNFVKEFNDFDIKGRIDLYVEIPDVLNFVVDFKSGVFQFNYPAAMNGLTQQLPTYVYLSQNANSDNIGAFIKKIFVSPVDIGSDTKLKGLYSSKEALNITGDKNAAKSFFGDIASRSNYTLEDYHSIVDSVPKLYQKAHDGIKNYSFDINPKRVYVVGKIAYEGCDLCPFQDICFRKNSNYVNILPKLEEETEEDE